MTTHILIPLQATASLEQATKILESIQDNTYGFSSVCIISSEVGIMDKLRDLSVHSRFDVPFDWALAEPNTAPFFADRWAARAGLRDNAYLVLTGPVQRHISPETFFTNWGGQLKVVLRYTSQSLLPMVSSQDVTDAAFKLQLSPPEDKDGRIQRASESSICVPGSLIAEMRAYLTRLCPSGRKLEDWLNDPHPPAFAEYALIYGRHSKNKQLRFQAVASEHELIVARS